MENLLEINNLTVEFSEFSLKGVSFKLKRGGIMGLIGQNGSGKTTVLNSIINSVKKNSGEIKVLGKDNILDEVFVKNNIGFVPSESFFFPNKTIEDHRNLFKHFYDEFDDEIYLKYMKKWKLKYYMKDKEMSKGMITKAMMALTLAHKPKLLILDEPTAGLDPVARLEFLEELREFVDETGNGVILATHITSDLDKVADYLTLIHEGEVKESDSIDNIQDKYLIVKGELEKTKGLENRFIGIKKWKESFEGLILRENLNEDLVSLKGVIPNTEDILTYYIWGSKYEENIL